MVEIGEDPDKQATNPNRRCPTWINTLLIKSTSLEKAYDKALTIANNKYPQSCKAVAGNTSTWFILGISSLREVSEDLKDGSEIDWSSRGRISYKNAQELVKTKEQLLNE